MNNIIGQIFSSSTKGIVDGIGGIVDNAFTNEEEKLQKKKEISELVTSELNKALAMQRDVLAVELKGNWLQRSWRPIVMLMFAFIVVYAKFIAPAFSLPNAILEDQFWTLLELGIGGYVVGRSVEKVADGVTKNMDLSFLKKKDRKDNFKY